MINWFCYLLLAWGLSWGISSLLIWWGKKHNKKIRRLGGTGVILSFLVVVFFSEVVITIKITGLLIGAVAILFFGIVDDFKKLSWRIQIIFQLFLAFLIIFFGFQIDFISLYPGLVWRLDSIGLWGGQIALISNVVLVLWIIAIINAFNWADGIDGVGSIIGVLASASIFFVSLRPEVNQPAVAILSLIFIGSLLGLAWLSFPPAKVITGTSGSYFIGFFLACLAVMAGTKIATLMIILALPILDALWVVYNRIKVGQSIFKGDRKSRHFHYQLEKLGWSKRKILINYFLFLSSVLLLSVVFSGENMKLVILGIEMVLILLALVWVERKTELK